MVNVRKVNRAAGYLLLAVVGLLAVGCGSNGSNGPSLGNATFLVNWPTPSAGSAHSIELSISDGAQVVATRVINAPSSSGQTTDTIGNIPIGNLTVTATAYPQNGGGGSPIGAVNILLIVTLTPTATITISPAGTITQIVIHPISPSLLTGQILQLIATPEDSQGDAVPVPTANLTWISTSSGVASVDNTGKVTANSLGNTQITAHESSSGKGATISLAVVRPDGGNTSGLQSGSSWPMFQANPYHSGFSSILGPQTNALLWDFVAGGAFANSAPAIGADGTIYIGSEDHNLYAINSTTGTMKWTFQTNDWVNSSPAIGADGTVYFGSNDHNVYAVDGATGTKKWSFNTGDVVTSSPVVGPDGTVYVGSDDDYVYALNGSNGNLIWKFKAGNLITSAPAIGRNGLLYAGSWDDKLYALNATSGAMVWSFTTGGSVENAPTIGPDGTVYFGSNDSNVYALNGDTGAVKWVFQAQSSVQSSPAIGPDGTLYIGSLDGRIYALDDMTGALKWDYQTAGSVISSPVVGSDSTVYIGSEDGNVYAINGSNGVLKWGYLTGNWVTASPAIGPDGTVYIGSLDHKLYAFK